MTEERKSFMNNSFQTSNGVSYLARQTTDMASITVDTTVVPTALSNITRSDVVFVENLMIDTHNVRQIIPVEKAVLKQECTNL